MTMTNSESRWLAGVMRTISCVAFMEPCNAVANPVQKGAGEDVLRAARSFLEVLKRGDGRRLETDEPAHISAVDGAGWRRPALSCF